MSKVKPELSKKNPYFIDRHRYYELKHFCLQYPTWKKAYDALSGLQSRPDDIRKLSKLGAHGDPTAKIAEAREYYHDCMRMVEIAAECTNPILGSYILKAVTSGVSYDYLKVNMDIPCCKDTYYDLYRRFFWLLSKARK